MKKTSVVEQIYLDPLHQVYRATVTIITYGMGLDMKHHTFLKNVGGEMSSTFKIAMKYEQRKL